VSTPPTPVIDIGPAGPALRPSDLFQYRELLYFFVWRDVKVRYKQTVLGAAWAVLQPLVAMVVFTVFIGRLGHMPSDGVGYAVWSFTGLVPWMYFANATTQAGLSLAGNANLITKVYFPRMLVPASSMVSGLLDFAIAFALVIVWTSLSGRPPGLALLLLPGAVLLMIVTTVAVGLALAALNVEYRDVRYATPFLLQVWLFATPVVYPSSVVPAPWRAWLGLNPMAGVVETFRAALLGTGVHAGLVLLSAGTAIAMLLAAAAYFSRVEKVVADVV
jgi:lipopolysaccharide transport system permease protein